MEEDTSKRVEILKFLNSRLANEELVARVKQTARRRYRDAQKVGNLKNIEAYMGTRLHVLKEKSIIYLNGPWHVKDGLPFKNASASPKDPFFLSSTIKILDRTGDTIAVVAEGKRGLANILSTAPLMYQLLVYLYMNKERLLVGDDEKFIASLDRLVESVGVAYRFELSDMDVPSFLSAVSERFLTLSMGKLVESGKLARLEAFLTGDEEQWDLNVWREYRVAVIDTLSKSGIDAEASFTKTVQFIQEIRDSKITPDSLVNVFSRIFHIKESAKGTIYTSSSFEMENIDEVYNFGADSKRDAIMTAPRKIKDINMNNLYLSVGIPQRNIELIPDSVSQRLKELLLRTSKTEQPSRSELLAAITSLYGQYSYYNDVYGFDIFEFESQAKGNA